MRRSDHLAAAFPANALEPQFVATRLDAHLLVGRGETHPLGHAVLEQFHVEVLEFQNALAIDADEMVVVRMVDEVRVVDLSPLGEVQFPQQPATHQDRQSAVNGRAAHRGIDLAGHLQKFVGGVVAIGAESRLDDGVALGGLAQPFAGKKVPNLIAHELVHGSETAVGTPWSIIRAPTPQVKNGTTSAKFLPPPPRGVHTPPVVANEPGTDDLKKQAAIYAVRYVEPGMTVGLGTGSTAVHAVREIARLHEAGQLAGIRTFATSAEIARIATDAGLPLIGPEGPTAIDVTIDGADEVDPLLNLIKGGGGALLHEKIVAQSTRRQIIVVDESKLSPCLGTRHALPVEVFSFGGEAQRSFLGALGGHPVLRADNKGTPFITDEGNIIYDCRFGPIADPEELAAELGSRAGVAAHGLFLGLTDDLIVASASGIKHLRLDRESGTISVVAD